MADDTMEHILKRNSVTPLELANHAFLLKKLPQSQEGNIESIEQTLLESLSLAVSQIAVRKSQSKLKSLLQSWVILQADPLQLRNILPKLGDGESTSIFIKKQNCTMLFTKLDQSKIRLVTFRSSLPNENFTKTFGDLRVTYPETSDILPLSDLLLSECFSRQVNDLCRNIYPVAMPATTKGGEQYGEIRETSNPFMISEFLVGILAPMDTEELESLKGTTGIKIQKKFRDQVNWKSAKIPFRRSGLWTSVKVVLQMISQEQSRNKNDGYILYKIFIIQMLSNLTVEYSRENLEGVAWDVIAQMMVKLARRTKKLSETSTATSKRLEESRQHTIQLVADILKKISATVSSQWKSVASPTGSDDTIKGTSKIIQDDSEWIADCRHHLPELTEHISFCVPPPMSQSGFNLAMIDPIDHTATLTTLLEKSKNLASHDEGIHLNEHSLWIFHVERFARCDLHKGMPCQDIFKLMLAYAEQVAHRYGILYADPVKYSRMIATVLKFISIVDEIATAAHPLVKEYSTGITPEMFQCLLLPDKEDMEMVAGLQKYFQDRNDAATRHNWIGICDVKKNSLPVRFAGKSESMISLRQKILADEKTDIENKKAEVKVAKQACATLQKKYDSIEECDDYTNPVTGITVHNRHCERCSIKAELEKKRYSVDIFQRPLPQQEYLQHAVVFELEIPQEIACLRDGYGLLQEEIYDRRNFKSDDSTYRWTAFRGLSRYTKSGFQVITHLGSENKDVLSTHYNRPDVMTSSVDEFIRYNGMNCVYTQKYFLKLNTQRPEQLCTFQVKNAKRLDFPVYRSLQFALENNRATENEAISGQYQCHQNLTLREFIAFGSLRCGHRIQIRNLYAAMASETLSLDKEPVVALLMQTLWEIGPENRAIHLDLESPENEKFASEFLRLLGNICKQNATNWGSPLLFLSLIIVTVRILELSPSNSLKEKAGLLLQTYRTEIEGWCVTLEGLISKHCESNLKQAKTLSKLLLKAVICSAFTFNVSSEELVPFVLRDDQDITYWLKTLHRLYQLVTRDNILSSTKFSPFFKNLLRHSIQVIPLNLESYLHDIFQSDPNSPSLHGFVCSKWHTAKQISRSIPAFSNNHPNTTDRRHAYVAKYKNGHTVCVDVLHGIFLVDGFPPSVLPESIIRHPLFRSYFISSQFRVQRDSQTFQTVDKYCGSHFEFSEVGDRLIIHQKLDDYWLELLPRELFKGKVPHDLVDHYTHWAHSKNKIVYFRRQTPSAAGEQNFEEDTDYILVPVVTDDDVISRAWYLKKYLGPNAPSNCHLLSIESPGFKKISGNLGKLEDTNFLHVHFDKQELTISANLWRFNLSFSLDRVDGVLHCDNYPGYYIPPAITGQHNLGTLVGLESGIVLEKGTVAEPEGKKKMFIIQHGTLSISQGETEKHQNVVVMGGGSRNPYFFVYEVDDLLKRLRPGNNKSAWLYLALLHAATSSPFPDPFTQVTGTEMAMWILQSGFCWSCSPYDSVCLQTLKEISEISPTYAYYPDHLKVMQSITWPKSLSKNSYAAYDGYAIIVRKLLKDSLRLGGLYTENPLKLKKSDLTLCKRSYFRNINMYNKAAHLSAEFIEDATKFIQPTTFSLSSSKGIHANSSLLQFAKYREKQIPASSGQTITSLIMTTNPLAHNIEITLTQEVMSTWLRTDSRFNWLQLYSAALKSECRNELTMMLGAMMYSGKCSLQQSLNLHNISLHPTGVQGKEFPRPLKSRTNKDYHPDDDEFMHKSIIPILKVGAGSGPSRRDFKRQDEYETAEKRFNNDAMKRATTAADYIKNKSWPAPKVESDVFQSILHQNGLENFSVDILEKVNSRMTNWYNNRQLKLFINMIDNILQRLQVTATLQESGSLQRQTYFIPTSFQADKWRQQMSTQDETQAEIRSLVNQICSTGQLETLMDVTISPSEQRMICITVAKRITKELKRVIIANCPGNQALTYAGIHTRTAPVSLLREQFEKGKGNCYVAALAIMWAHIRRLNRLVMYDSDKEKYSVELARELETREFENWNPLENPEWLLLELELDVTIRAVQVQVARQMMNMPGEKNGKRNGVMQLNMGEGKTSVIIPMIVATLSSRKECLCRVTVLNSIYATNFNLLAATIGGFLNKRLYAMPCNRDLDIERYVDQIQLVYSECMKLGGIVMTLPEYRLSFRLQAYSKFLQDGKVELASKIYGIESWLRKHARDLVDESDEIFSVKYQLIYTTGQQVKLDGGSMRWETSQKILDYIPKVAEQLFEKFGSKVIEFEVDKAARSPEKFTHFRILSDECKQDFCILFADGLLEGKISLIGRLLTGDEGKIIKEFLTNENISKRDHEKFFEIDDIAQEKVEALMLVSGYLRRGILFAALKKRWRVEFGVKVPKPGSTSKLMAVPFRAKDVAADRTEFGHPDLAIILTQLSYYYSGLSDQQLFQCFQLLAAGVTEPEKIYNSWITRFPVGKIIPDTIRSYKGVNLQDYVQRTEHLFPILRHHKGVIDFWLENVTFPIECRQFPGKLVTNAWDLCYERNEHATTGFSGTNETSLLLPAQIIQHDLAALAETNANMEKTLERAENGWKRSLEMGHGCKQILQFMTLDGLRVLIDSGALMLQLGNEDVAQLWLEMDKQLDAVVYFDKNGEIVVKIRRQISGRKQRECDQLLTLSPFKDRLENCGIYLDDQHTRGTDIRLPTNFKACVTVGSRMRRDKLIQACMRMRKLGKGQSVNFYLSHEVDNKIRLGIGQRQIISVNDIISWAKENSTKFGEDGLVYWATNARNYAKNLAADDLFELSGKSQEDGKILGKRFEDPDFQTLKDMYGMFHQKILVTMSIPVWFVNIPTKLLPAGPITSNDHMDILNTVQGISSNVLMKCMTHIPEMIFFRTMLEEEQEKELEPEQELEIQIRRPSQETPLLPNLHPNVSDCVKGLKSPCVMDGICTLPDIFKDTTIGTKIQSQGWGEHWFVTEDFVNVIRTGSSASGRGNMDSFLRPVRFLVSFKNGSDAPTILVLSLHEVNCLMSYFRKRCAPGTKLHMFSPRWMDGKPIFVNDPRLQMPLVPGSLDESCIAPLLVAAGNLFFESKAEQTAFSRFLGLRLKPWTEEEETAFQEKQITKSGFVLPDFQELREGCGFTKDPIDMVRRILRMRNAVLRDMDHAVFILDTCTYVPE